MMNAYNIVCLKFYRNPFIFINLVLYSRFFIYIFKTASITFLSYILFELLDVEHGTPISQKSVCLFVCFVALRPKSTAMVIAGRSVHLTTLFPGQA